MTTTKRNRWPLPTDLPYWRVGFETALDRTPGDRQIREQLAEKLEEWGDPDCEPQRFMAETYTCPARVHRGGTWAWYAPVMTDNPQRVTSSCELSSRAQWAALLGRAARGDNILNPTRRLYDSRFIAEAFFCQAWHASTRDRLIEGVVSQTRWAQTDSDSTFRWLREARYKLADWLDRQGPMGRLQAAAQRLMGDHQTRALKRGSDWLWMLGSELRYSMVPRDVFMLLRTPRVFLAGSNVAEIPYRDCWSAERDLMTALAAASWIDGASLKD